MGTRPEHWRPELLELFEHIRNHIQHPLYIVSGWRCPRHNTATGGAAQSQHCIGAALDIRCPAMNYNDFADAAEYAARTHSNGQAGFGIYPDPRSDLFVHVDLGLNLPPGRRWSA